MPGRQVSGRVGSGQTPRKVHKARSKSKGIALDAYAIAERQVPPDNKGIGTRDINPEPEQKRRRRDAEDGGEESGPNGRGGS